MKSHQFTYRKFDIREHLHPNWHREIMTFAEKNEERKIIKPCSVTSRESSDIKEIESLIVDGEKLRNGLPWIFDLYEKKVYELGKNHFNEDLLLSKEDLYAVNLNIQRGSNMRYECHVDSNPLQGVLFVTSSFKDEGGELVVSNNPYAIGVDQIEKDCEVITPKSGILLLFNANKNPHYVRPMKRNNAIRISVTMNFYTPNSPESLRPTDLNRHLF